MYLGLLRRQPRALVEGALDDGADLLALGARRAPGAGPAPVRRPKPAMFCASLICWTSLWPMSEMQQRHEPAIERQRLPVATRADEIVEPHRFLGESVDQAGDPADAAEHHAFQDEIVDAAEQRVAVAGGVDDIGERGADRRRIP